MNNFGCCKLLYNRTYYPPSETVSSSQASEAKRPMEHEIMIFGRLERGGGQTNDTFYYFCCFRCVSHCYNSDYADGFGDLDFLQDGDISAIGIHFSSILHFIARNASYFCFQSAWPTFVKKCGTRSLQKEIICTKLEADLAVRFRVMKL